MKTTRLLLPLLAILAGITVFLACNKYKDKPYVAPGLPADQMITASVQGRVLDQNGIPVQGAVVTSDTAGTTTDVNGAFSFNKIAMSSRFGYVKVTAPGYFAGSRSIITSAGGSNYVTITLIPRTARGAFPAANGGGVVVQIGDTVNFDPGTIVTASTNAAYTGTVHVYAAYLDPTSSSLSQNMPGDLRGIGSDGKETALQTFGMMVVELEGDGGEKLQIASGKTASITMTIPDTLLKAAPATIPLWYFNDTTGKWIEQGTATRKGNTYRGTTSHFTWWNCDAPQGTVNFKVRLKDQHGKALANYPIQFNAGGLGIRGGYTDSTGYAEGMIPKGVAMVFQVMSACNTLLYGVNVGPALTDQDLGTLTVVMDSVALTLKGKVVDCSDNPVASGYVNIAIDGQTYRAAVTAGSFIFTINRCQNSITDAQLTAGDFTTQQQGTTTTTSVNIDTVDVGQLSACGVVVDQFITINVAGSTFSVTTPPDAITYNHGSSETDITGVPSQQSNPVKEISMTFYALTGPGTISNNYHFSMNTNTQLFWGNALTFNVTDYGTVNGYMTGSISGTMVDTATFNRPSYTTTGTFKIKRTN